MVKRHPGRGLRQRGVLCGSGRGRARDTRVVERTGDPGHAVPGQNTVLNAIAWTSGLVHGEPGAAHDGDPAGGDESVESRGEEHMRQAENADAEAAGQPAEGAGDRRGAHEDG